MIACRNKNKNSAQRYKKYPNCTTIFQKKNIFSRCCKVDFAIFAQNDKTLYVVFIHKTVVFH